MLAVSLEYQVMACPSVVDHPAPDSIVAYRIHIGFVDAVAQIGIPSDLPLWLVPSADCPASAGGGRSGAAREPGCGNGVVGPQVSPPRSDAD